MTTKAQNTSAAQQQAELQTAVCLNDWNRAIQAINALIGSSDASVDREQLIEFRHQVEDWRARGTRFSSSPNCEAVANAAPAQAPRQQPLDWESAVQSISQGNAPSDRPERDRLPTTPPMQGRSNPAPAHAVNLLIVPEQLLIVRAGETRSLQVKAYDLAGREISTTGLNLQWTACTPNLLQLNPSAADPSVATVTSLTDVGAASVMVRSAAYPEIPPVILDVSIAQLRPGVQIIPASRVVFPPPNLPPIELPANYPLADITPPDASGQVQIGTFRDEEVAALVGGTDSILSAYLPFVLRGNAPAVGSLIVGDGADIFGRVRQAQTRGNFSLIQVSVDIGELPNIFAGLEERTSPCNTQMSFNH